MSDSSENSFLEFSDEDVVKIEVIEHPAPAHERTLSRRVAVQVLYEVDSADHLVGDVLQRQTQVNNLPLELADYTRDIVLGVINNHRALDTVIKHFAPEFPLSQVAIIDRNILRIAIYEFALKRSVPTSIAIDEAVELAKLYGADGSARFVNGVLGAIADDRPRLNTMLNPTDVDDNAPKHE